VPLTSRATLYADRPALLTPEGSWTYAELDQASARVASALLDGGDDLREARVAYQIVPGRAHVAVLWGIWRAGGIAVPLALSYPAAELAHLLADSDPSRVVADAASARSLAPLAAARQLPLLTPEQLLSAEPVQTPKRPAERGALMIYTSGTTGRPKGVVLSHGNLAAQVVSLAMAWGWTPDDRILLTLPLHHVHGIVNVLCCALWTGARCEIHTGFDAVVTWQRLASNELTLYMAVPTIYARLIRAWEEAPDTTRAGWSAGCGGLRLMVSGSAALPVALFTRWRELTGHTLLERYGMSEIGMGLSNPLEGERRPGFVGAPLPGVEVRLCDEAGLPTATGQAGEIEVRGPTVFREYWRRPEETRAAFHDGWFRTGDIGIVEDGSYRILGRRSVDILKTAGYKVSALEIENVLRDHPCVADCAVVGVPDPEWGETICVAVEAAPGAVLPDLAGLKAFAGERLAPQKVPRRLALVPALPRNAMGKVVKGEVKALFEAGGYVQR